MNKPQMIEAVRSLRDKFRPDSDAWAIGQHILDELEAAPEKPALPCKGKKTLNPGAH